MKIAYLICRLLLGIMFTVFGANGFLHFIPQPPFPPGFAMQYMGAIFGSGYFALIFATQLLAGILLLFGRYVPLALALLAPVLANILFFHLTMEPAGIPPGIVATLLWVVCVLNNKAHFLPLFESKTRTA
jgi:uncharacterized membrane protein YphA (DoxX/SURF4 family)